MSAFNNGSGFSRFAQTASRMTGAPRTFMLAVAIVAVWGVTGPLFDFSDTWQLVINTGTTIITFLMVFLIQNTQNRDAEAMHIKLDELIRTSREAHDSLLDLEELTTEDLEQIRARYTDLAKRARDELRGETDEASGRRTPGSEPG
ncbi:MAG: low affinity iron permease family protein [Thiobacillus sp.]|nr:low affinity iron permease family protein [Thiobacillus sp.]